VRFGFVLGALAAIGACAVAFVLLFVSSGGGSGPKLAANWSAWQPETTRMLDGAAEIASHIGGQYKLDDGSPLVQISASDLDTAGLDVAVQPLRSRLQFLEGEGLTYFLTGSGDKGVLRGEPSQERGRLLLREALELALYSFRYLDDVSMVAVLIPDAEEAAGETAEDGRQRALFFRPGDLLPQLQVPLAETLAAKTPTAKSMTESEAARVDSLALRYLFFATIQPLGTDGRYLLLEEPAEVQ
jgi:hypothetical protein